MAKEKEIIEEKGSSSEGSYELRTHKKINQVLSGKIVELRDGYAKVSLVATEEMAADEMGLVHGGFTFSAADFAAMAAVNHPNVVLVGAKTRFLAPMKVGDEAIFEAKASHTTTKKRDVSVTAVVNGIKIFEGEFATVVLDRHVLKMSIT